MGMLKTNSNWDCDVKNKFKLGWGMLKTNSNWDGDPKNKFKLEQIQIWMGMPKQLKIGI